MFLDKYSFFSWRLGSKNHFTCEGGRYPDLFRIDQTLEDHKIVVICPVVLVLNIERLYVHLFGLVLPKYVFNSWSDKQPLVKREIREFLIESVRTTVVAHFKIAVLFKVKSC